MSGVDWYGCDYEHCGYEGTAAEVDAHMTKRHDPASPDWDQYEADGAPCCPDPGCPGNPCTFPGYAENH